MYSMKYGTILIVDDNEDVLFALNLLLKPHFEKVKVSTTPERIAHFMATDAPEVILLDMNFSRDASSGQEGMEVLQGILARDPEAVVVMMTAYSDMDKAIAAIKAGATDFVAKPWENEKLVATLTAAAKLSRVRREKASLQEQMRTMAQSAVPPIIGRSAAMVQLMDMVERLAQTDANILILGENGTGKEMLAREIHALSNRFRRDMVTVDMGAVTETLFESELFGHKKGAFTDAHTDRAGKFEAAHESTIFLDEIGNLPYHLQSKLLTVLQSRSVVRVGTNHPIPVDVRLICATNANLDERVAQGKFREDLLYRINTIHLEIPPLRERKEDIIPLAELFIERFARQYNKGAMSLSEEAKQKLKEHPWYGNIRELEHAIEKAVIICDDVTISDAIFHFPKKSLMPLAQDPDGTIADMELILIRKAMDKHEGNLSAVAAQLGITRQTLYNKMKKYGL